MSSRGESFSTRGGDIKWREKIQMPRERKRARAENRQGGKTNNGDDAWASMPSDHTKYKVDDKCLLYSIKRGSLDIMGMSTYAKGEVEGQDNQR